MSAKGQPPKPEPSSERGPSKLESRILSKLTKGKTLTATQRATGLHVFADFFGLPVDESTFGQVGASLPRFGHSTSPPDDYPLPELPAGFRDWKEWETIVLSKLQALVRLRLTNGKLLPSTADVDDLLSSEIDCWYLASIVELGMTGRDLPVDQFAMLGKALAKERKAIPFRDLERFFRQVTDKRDNYLLGLAHETPPRLMFIVENWIHFTPSNRKLPQFCTLDNSSIIEILADWENENEDEPDLANLKIWEEKRRQMQPSNLSRTKGMLRLVSCKKKTWKMQRERIASKIDGTPFEVIGLVKRPA